MKLTTGTSQSRESGSPRTRGTPSAPLAKLIRRSSRKEGPAPAKADSDSGQGPPKLIRWLQESEKRTLRMTQRSSSESRSSVRINGTKRWARRSSIIQQRSLIRQFNLAPISVAEASEVAGSSSIERKVTQGTGSAVPSSLWIRPFPSRNQLAEERRSSTHRDRDSMNTSLSSQEDRSS